MKFCTVAGMRTVTVDTVIEPSADTDLAGLVGSVAGLWRADSGRHDPSVNPDWPQRSGADYFRSLLADPNAVVLAARTGPNGAVVGHLVGRYVPASDFRIVSTAVLESMQVRADLRGQGIGGRVVDAFLAWAAARGADRAVVMAYSGNTGAQAFYRRHGFAPLSVTLTRPVGAPPELSRVDLR